MFAAPGQWDAQRERLSTAGWRQLKAALFLARPGAGSAATANRRDRGASVLERGGLARPGSHQHSSGQNSQNRYLQVAEPH